MKTADILIIGGGIFGVNLAYALATHGARNVVLLEQDRVAAGSSGKATGGLRQQFADELDIRFSVEGINFYRDFVNEHAADEEAYRPPHFYQHGYLFLCGTTRTWQAFQTYTERQQALGVPTRLLTPAEVSAHVPPVNIDDLLGATFCPTDGYSDPGAMTRALAHAARALGVTILEHAPARAIHVKHNRIEGVSTDQGTIATPLIVNATGPYAGLTARMTGIMDLPLWPLKRQLYQTEPCAILPPDAPMVVDAETSFHFRPRDGGVMLTMPLPVSPIQIERNRRLEPEAFALNLDETLWPGIQNEIKRRCPALMQAMVRQAWTGLYDMTPDEHPILGPTPVEGFLCGCGLAGHGFMHSPRAARLLTEYILAPQNRSPEFELLAWHASRQAN